VLSLSPFQHRLETIYGITTQHDVDDFLITDRELAERIEGTDDSRAVEEKLLIREQADGIDLSLFLDAELVRRLAKDNPTQNLHDGNLADFCTALEGVSHFVHLVWRALETRVTSHLELELQAEVDKFVSSVNLLSQQGQEGAPPDLHRRLFDQVSYAANLSAGERLRYQEANRFAARYCRHLEARFLRPYSADRDGLGRELRDFYRLELRDKIARIERAAAG
jgi:hypothetical protein